MAVTGVSFQPGQQGGYGQSNSPQRQMPEGVQEAIKVLSLRLPRVVGANAIAPAPLLNSPGAGGHVDGIVSNILSKLMPSGATPPQAPAPMVPSNAPSFAGGGASPLAAAAHYQPAPSAPIVPHFSGGTPDAPRIDDGKGGNAGVPPSPWPSTIPGGAPGAPPNASPAPPVSGSMPVSPPVKEPSPSASPAEAAIPNQSLLMDMWRRKFGDY